MRTRLVSRTHSVKRGGAGVGVREAGARWMTKVLSGRVKCSRDEMEGGGQGESALTCDFKVKT